MNNTFLLLLFATVYSADFIKWNDDPDLCSQHGWCNLNGVCMCHKYYRGYDCSEAVEDHIILVDGDVMTGDMGIYYVVLLLIFIPLSQTVVFVSLRYCTDEHEDIELK